MVILSAVLGAAALPLSKALRTERFERGVDQIITRLAFAQEVMLDFETDVLVTLEREDKEITCSIKTQKVLPPAFEKILNLHKKIQGIDEMSFDNEILNKIEIHFDSSLGTTTKGKLTLHLGNQEEILTLKGHPTQIKRGDYAKILSSEAHYPQEIVSAL